ncbi:MAG: glycosyltransferase [bacterium]
MIHNLAIVTTEALPCFTTPCAGGGVRIWGIGEALRRRNVPCTYFLREGTPGLSHPPAGLPLRIYKPERLREEIRDAGCDAALFEQWQPLTFLSESLAIPVIADLPGPLALEYYWRDPADFYQHIVDKVECLARADYFLCAHERQWGYYMAWLTWAGVSPEDHGRLAVLPFLLHEMPVSRQGHVEDEPLFFWGGLFWPWHDRAQAFQVLVETVSRLRQGQIVVAGSEGEDSLRDRQGNTYNPHPHVSWLGSLPFSEYVIELKRATVAVDIGRPTAERCLSSDLRTGTALWAGTPCIVTPESPWADWIEKHNAGWIVPYHDTRQLARLIEEIALERGDIKAKRRGAIEISRSISDESHLDPLSRWLENSSKRGPSATFFTAREADREHRVRDMRREIDRLRHESDSLRHDLEAIRSQPLFRLYKRLMGWRKK